MGRTKFLEFGQTAAGGARNVQKSMAALDNTAVRGSEVRYSLDPANRPRIHSSTVTGTNPHPAPAPLA